MSVVTTDDSPSSIPFANKMLAFRALKQGLKFSFENWRMWTNYMIVSMDVGELAEACRALGRIVEQRYDKIGAEAVDEDVLDRLVDAVTELSVPLVDHLLLSLLLAQTAGPLRKLPVPAGDCGGNAGCTLCTAR